VNSKDKALKEIIESSDYIFHSIGGKIKEINIIPLSMFATIVDIANDIQILYGKKRLSSATILLRSLIDSLFDLFLLELDINNIHYLRYRDLNITKNHNELFLNPKNAEYSGNEETRISYQLENKELKFLLKELKRNGYEYKNLNMKFQLTNAQIFHKTVYQYLNKEVHNSFNILEKRHFYIGKDGRRKLKYLAEYSEGEYPVFDPLVISFIFATNSIRKVLNIVDSSPILNMVNLANEHLENKIGEQEIGQLAQ